MALGASHFLITAKGQVSRGIDLVPPCNVVPAGVDAFSDLGGSLGLSQQTSPFDAVGGHRDQFIRCVHPRRSVPSASRSRQPALPTSNARGRLSPRRPLGRVQCWSTRWRRRYGTHSANPRRCRGCRLPNGWAPSSAPTASPAPSSSSRSRPPTRSLSAVPPAPLACYPS